MSGVTVSSEVISAFPRMIIQQSFTVSKRSNSTVIFISNIIVIFIIIATTPLPTTCITNFSTGCKISEKWWGRYYQSGLGFIFIGENHVTTKGICINKTKDFYIFFNSEEECFYCLVMLRVHHNIIRYRESHCVKTKLHNICYHIQLETPMHTLVRENSDAIQCPMNGVYVFNINDHLREPCPSMDSIAKPCVGNSRYQMVIRNCNHEFKAQSELNLECVGIWKDGSDSYLYVRISRKNFKKPEDTFRCLRYQEIDLEIRAALSADASCEGLRSSNDGPYVLRLVRNNTEPRDNSCQFPDWLDDVVWFDNEQNVKIKLDKEAGILTEYKRFILDSSKRILFPVSKWTTYEQSMELRCFDIGDVQQESDHFLVAVGKNHQCDVEFQCLKITKYSKSVFASTKSDLDKVTSDPSTCLNIGYGPRQVLFADHIFSTTSICFSPGVYYSTYLEDCPKRVLIGCHGNARILMDRICEEQIDLFDCTTSWSDKKTIFIAARKLNVGSIHCFVINIDSKILHFDEDCAGFHVDQESLIFKHYEPCHSSNPPYKLFTPSNIVQGTFMLTYDDEDRKESSGFEDLDENISTSKREKHIYLTNDNSYVTVEGIWEVNNMNHALGPTLASQRNRICALLSPILLAISSVHCYLKISIYL